MQAKACDGKGLVQFDQVDVRQLQAGALERLLRGRHWPGPHHGRIDADNGRSDDPDQRLEAAAPWPFRPT